MENLNGCQLPCLPNISEGKAIFEPQPFDKRLKRRLARIWNYHVKKTLRKYYSQFTTLNSKMSVKESEAVNSKADPIIKHMEAGDLVRVRSLEEIQATLNPFKELKGCAFLEEMKQYCNTQQRVFKVLERFLDERDYEVKKTKGIVLLDGIYCQGTPVFGRCDRSCLLFWREEWLERICITS
jgi:hypothetical protein